MMRNQRNGAPQAHQEEVVLRPLVAKQLEGKMKNNIRLGISVYKSTQEKTRYYKRLVANIMHTIEVSEYEIKEAKQYKGFVQIDVSTKEGNIEVYIDDAPKNSVIRIMRYINGQKYITKTSTHMSIKPFNEKLYRVFSVITITMPYAKRIGTTLKVTPSFLYALASLIEQVDALSTKDGEQNKIELNNKVNLLIYLRNKYFMNNKKTEFVDKIALLTEKGTMWNKFISLLEVKNIFSVLVARILHYYFHEDYAVTLIVPRSDSHTTDTIVRTVEEDNKEYMYTMYLFASNGVTFRVDYATSKRVLYTSYPKDDAIVRKLADYYGADTIETQIPALEVHDKTLYVNRLQDVTLRDIVIEAAIRDAREIKVNFANLKKEVLSYVAFSRAHKKPYAIINMYAKYYRNKNTIYLIGLLQDKWYGDTELGIITDMYNGFPVIIIVAGEVAFNSLKAYKFEPDEEHALRLLHTAYAALANPKTRRTLLSEDVVAMLNSLFTENNENTDTNIGTDEDTVDESVLYDPELAKEDILEALIDRTLTPDEYKDYLTKLSSTDTEVIKRTIDELVEKGVIVR